MADYSDGEIQLNRQPQRSISVFDLIPTEPLRSQFFVKRSKTPQPKHTAEKKAHVTRQLSEVQAKLFALKNKLWFGIGNGDEPLSWGSGGVIFSDSRTISPKKKNKMKKLTKKQEKSDKKLYQKESQFKPESKEKPSKYQNGLRRQPAVEWPQPGNKTRIRKSRSLPDTSSYDPVREKTKVATEAETGDEEKRDRKKKKKRGKLAKKAKAISNAKTFIHKD